MRRVVVRAGVRTLAEIYSRALLTTALLLPLAVVGSGLWLLSQAAFGDRVRAEVLGCHLDGGYPTHAQHCVARWTVDGVERTGPIEASGDGDVGKTVSATERHGVLYRTSLALPLLLLVLGLPGCWFPFVWVRRRLRRARAAP